MGNPKLRLIGFDDIQLVRYWRNLDHVRSRMVHTDFVTYSGQQNWFKEMDHHKTRYFIYSLDSVDVGIATISKINKSENSFEGGIQCGDVKYLGHWINIWACVKIYNMGFDEMKLNKSFATILNDNHAAIRLNKSLGYHFLEEISENVSKYFLTKENYFNDSKGIQKFLYSFDKTIKLQ